MSREEGDVAADVDAWAQAGLIYEQSEGVAWLRLNRPERRNAMDHYPRGQGPHGMGLRDALLEAIRNDKTSLNAEIEEGHKSTLLCHIGNIAYIRADHSGIRLRGNKPHARLELFLVPEAADHIYFVFKVTRSRGGDDIVTTYTGRLVGDTIKGKAATEMAGQTRPHDWQAERVKDDPPDANPATQP